MAKNFYDRLNRRDDELMKIIRDCEAEYSRLMYEGRLSGEYSTKVKAFDEYAWEKDNRDTVGKITAKGEEAEMRHSEYVSEYYSLAVRDIPKLCEDRIAQHKARIAEVSQPDYDMSKDDPFIEMCGSEEAAEIKERELRRLGWAIEEAKYIQDLARIDVIIPEYKLYIDEAGKLNTTLKYTGDIPGDDITYIQNHREEIMEYIRDSVRFDKEVQKYEVYVKLLGYVEEFKDHPYCAKRIHYFASQLVEGAEEPEELLRICDRWAADIREQDNG